MDVPETWKRRVKAMMSEHVKDATSSDWESVGSSGNLSEVSEVSQHIHHKTTVNRRDYVGSATRDRKHARKSLRSGTSSTLPEWRNHTGGSQSIPTVHPCLACQRSCG